jgi:hypothetical protein
MDEWVEEPERRIGPWGCERFVFLFPDLCQFMSTLLPAAHGLQCFLPPSRPETTSAYDLSSRLVAEVFQTATLEEHR